MRYIKKVKNHCLRGILECNKMYLIPSNCHYGFGSIHMNQLVKISNLTFRYAHSGGNGESGQSVALHAAVMLPGADFEFVLTELLEMMDVLDLDRKQQSVSCW